MAWEHFEHAADVGVRGRGDTPARAFGEAARALFSLLSADLDRIRPSVEERVECDAANLEELLVAYLNELLFLFDSRRVVFGSFEVAIEERSGRVKLTGMARGEPFDPERHEFTVLPKGATFTALEVARRDGEWIAQCVVDV
ncbi:MAG TPA: archease [Thermoanaerobaculia bacterium]|nr:archease [Thermoanaerobaculia bacterium]